MRYICSGCKAPYGDGINKPKFGYCEACWELWLARGVAGVATQRVERLLKKQQDRKEFHGAEEAKQP